MLFLLAQPRFIALRVGFLIQFFLTRSVSISSKGGHGVAQCAVRVELSGGLVLGFEPTLFLGLPV